MAGRLGALCSTIIIRKHMTSIAKMKPALRIDSSNRNHHIYLNNGTWWIHYTAHMADYTAKRIRFSLDTKDVLEARLRRDLHLQGLLEERGAA
jgi:hypothetical protein